MVVMGAKFLDDRNEIFCPRHPRTLPRKRLAVSKESSCRTSRWNHSCPHNGASSCAKLSRRIGTTHVGVYPARTNTVYQNVSPFGLRSKHFCHGVHGSL